MRNVSFHLHFQFQWQDPYCSYNEWLQGKPGSPELDIRTVNSAHFNPPEFHYNLHGDNADFYRFQMATIDTEFVGEIKGPICHGFNLFPPVPDEVLIGMLRKQ